MSDITISPKTRFFEGFFNGIKFGFVHSLVFAPFTAKSVAIDTDSSYRRAYVNHCLKAFGFYSIVLATTFGLRQFVVDNKDSILFELQFRFKFFRQKREAGNIVLCSLFSWPLGMTLNYFNTGRILRGTFSYTMFMTMLVYWHNVENGKLS
jgi:hypothetical protein